MSFTMSWSVAASAVGRTVRSRVSPVLLTRNFSYFLGATSRIYDVPSLAVPRDQQVRWKKKSAKMGNRLEVLEEMAHRKSHERAVERRKKKKQTKNKGGVSSSEEETDDQDEDTFEEAEPEEEEEEDDDRDVLPDPDNVRSRMMKIVNQFEKIIKGIRGAEPSAELFDTIQVNAYGSRTPLSAVGQVVISSPTLATVTCFDPAVAPDVRNAIRDQLELNPQLEDGVVMVPLPKVSMETREKTAKQLKKKTENHRQKIRHVRQKAMQIIKKVKDGKIEHVSEDDAFRAAKKIEAVTDEVINKLNDMAQKKHDSVMAIS